VIDLPDQPEGSLFKVRPCDWGWRIVWRPRPHRSASIWSVYELLLAAIGLAAAGILLSAQASTTGLESLLLALGELAALLFAGLAIALFLRHRTLSREVLMLGRDEMDHFPAWSPARASVAFMPDFDDWFLLGRIARWRDIFSARRRTTVPRDEVDRIQVVGKGRFEHVSVAMRSGHCDMGKHLSHADREWLVELLRRWKGATA